MNYIAESPPAQPLVTYAKSSGKFREVIDEKTGEIQRFTFNPRRSEFVLDSDKNDARFARFVLQGAARRLLPEHRVSKCYRGVTAAGGFVSILKDPTTNRCHYSGVQTCSSVWACPVCTAKISERRKMEARHALDTHLAAGGGLEMVTLTFPHKRHDVLAELMVKLRQSLVVFKRNRDYTNAKEVFELMGSIRALEVTWGERNGWHPHIHEIWFFAEPLTVAQRRLLTTALYAGWSSACVKSGLPKPNRQRGVHLQPAKSAADYISKWGVEPRWEAASELTKHHAKKSQDAKGRTPFDLLRDYADGNKRAGALFANFVEVFSGMRFRQNYWSPGLKGSFGIEDLSNEAIMAKKLNPAAEVCKMTVFEWRTVLKLPYEARSLLLVLAENGGIEAVRQYLMSIFPAGWRPLEALPTFLDAPFSAV
jgi:hypothetical protein